MKKCISLILAFVFVIGVFATAPLTLVADATSVDDLIFEINEDGTMYQVIGCKDGFSGDLVIPDTYKGLPVTRIGPSAFAQNKKIKSITIPSSITSIGNEAFFWTSQFLIVNITDIAAWCNITFGENGANPLVSAEKLYLNNELITDLVIPEGVKEI
ncbi:MAG: leucine-rich repeat protein, partial [Clostridia bacterium]|nr:leucine-rich repeat protein [Clostridia bacterium]